MNRSEYLKQFLIGRGTPASSLTVRGLTSAEVQRMSEYEYEWHQRENAANIEKTLQPPPDKQEATDRLQWQKFMKTRSLNPEQVQTAKDAMDRLCSEYPALVNNQHNQEEISGYLISKNQLPRWETVRDAYLELAPTGRLFLDPSRVGVMRFGEEGISGHAVSQLTAHELSRLTKPYRSQDEANLSADEYWDAHPELAAERFKHDRAAVARAEFRKAEAEVERFLNTQVNYQPTVNSKKLMLDFVEKNYNGQLTAENLFAAFNALKSELAQSDKGISYGTTNVVDFGERNQNPSYVSTELKDSIRRKIARYDSGQYNEWLIRHPEEAAILDEQ